MSSPARNAQAAASTHPRADRGSSVGSLTFLLPKLAGGVTASPASFGSLSKSQLKPPSRSLCRNLCIGRQ